MANMVLSLFVWRQAGPDEPGKLVPYKVDNVSPDMSFLEMLDVLNLQIIRESGDPIEFDSDCREGICGMCSLVINGVPHGPESATATCQLHMRHFRNGDTITVEPWRARAFPVVKDLVVDRSAFDRIISAGGYVSVNTGGAPEANAVLVPKDDAETAMDMAACIGCGACVAACPNASASLFVAAKIAQLAHLPQGHPERKERVQDMVKQMDEEAFGNCSNIAECQAVCPKEIPISAIAKMRREYIRTLVR
ncbi:MAG: succinate dehydrogenase/fumarate reductase iron-sulfur subunit [Candidatus Latescibacteria bacterium]|jgi:succinate dehydrogenase / fumarate reductase iron-sulfur subunit|nr:succinate dehydrogenase/fumarate reductase iron-sulfur subunit [Candidatus Latescibacterota bacterium]